MRLKVSLLCTPVTTVTAAKIALKPVFLTRWTTIMCRHFTTKENTGYLEQFLAGPSSAWSQLHWQGAGLQSPESQRKEQFNMCVGNGLLLWWIISHAQSQQAGKSQKEAFHHRQASAHSRGGPQTVPVAHHPLRFPFQATHSLPKEGCCKLPANRAANPTAYPRSHLLQLPKQKNQRCEGTISL